MGFRKTFSDSGKVLSGAIVCDGCGREFEHESPEKAAEQSSMFGWSGLYLTRVRGRMCERKDLCSRCSVKAWKAFMATKKTASVK